MDGNLINLDLGISFDSKYDRPIRVMPLGDSITYGVVEYPGNLESGGYRLKLWNQLQELGLDTDFVGSQSNGPNTFDNEHNGYRGRTIDWLASNNWSSDQDGTPEGLSSSLQNEQPDIILLMAGTNDTASDSVSNMITDMNSLIDKITNLSPNTELLVASIPPIRPEASGGTTRVQKAEDFNAALPNLIDSWAAQGRNVTFVPTNLTLNDISSPDIDNGLHPNDGGHAKIAAAWYDAILDTTGEKQVLSNLNNAVGTNLSDKIIGNAGANIIEGGVSNDILTGKGGSDTFMYRSASEGFDKITDFGANDFFSISASGFGGGLSADVPLSTSASSTGVFVSDVNPTPLGSNANFLYNSSTGLLSFDVDGVGAGQVIPLATLDTTPTLSVEQFTIVA